MCAFVCLTGTTRKVNDQHLSVACTIFSFRDCDIAECAAMSLHGVNKITLVIKITELNTDLTVAVCYSCVCSLVLSLFKKMFVSWPFKRLSRNGNCEHCNKDVRMGLFLRK